MASGDLMLDGSGNVILDSSGNEQLSDGTGDSCCCGNKCYQSWTAVWHCDTSEWVITAGAKSCLPASTVTTWTGSGCTRQIYVDMGHACTVDGDCTGLSNTATPSAPNGGLEPDGCCCGGCDTCLIVPDPGCCSPCGTPDQITVTITSISASPDPLCNGAPPWDVEIIDVSGLNGRSFVVPNTGGCNFSATFDVAAWAKVLSCDGDSSGCPSCTPTTDITTSATMTLTWTPGGDVLVNIAFTTSNEGSPTRNLNGGFSVTMYDAFASEYHTCCQAWTATCTDPACADPSTGPTFFAIYVQSLSVVPC